MKHINIFASLSKPTLGLIAALSVAGCSGSGSGSSDDPGLTFADLDAVSQALVDTYVTSDGDLLDTVSRTDNADIPDMGTVQYNGYIQGAVAGDVLVGTLTLDVNFLNDTLNATADGFIHETDGAYSGSLTGTGIVDGDAAAGMPQVVATLDGTLQNGGTDHVSTLAIDGVFVDVGTDTAVAVAGAAEGNIGVLFVDDGIFAAEN